MTKIKTLLLLIVVASLTSCDTTRTESNGAAEGTSANVTHQVVMASEVDWEQLNPARGDKSPMAGTLWGDRKGNEPTGFLVKFVDEFSSPPHIHNVAYRGVVIRGLVHNDDPEAGEMWMPAGSFWTQPAGEVHITSANDSVNIAFIEIDSGPYLVLPTEEAFDSGERPINIHTSNIVWVDQPGMPATPNGPKVAFLWDDTSGGGKTGSFAKLPAGFTGTIRTSGKIFRAVVTQGQVKYQVTDDAKTLDPGSYFGSNGAAEYRLSCEGGTDCILYIQAEDTFEIVPLEDEH